MTAIATLAIAALGCFQWYAMHRQRIAMEDQARYMKEGLAETRKAADASRDSADTAMRAFASSRRPRLSMRLTTLPDGVRGMQISGTFLAVNTGDTPAHIKRGYSEIIVGSNLPGFPAGYLNKSVEMGATIAPGGYERISFPAEGPRDIDTAEFMAIGNRKEATEKGLGDEVIGRTGNIYLIGWIEYSDEADYRRTFGFCRKCDYRTQRLETYSDPDYNYDE